MQTTDRMVVQGRVSTSDAITSSRKTAQLFFDSGNPLEIVLGWSSQSRFDLAPEDFINTIVVGRQVLAESLRSKDDVANIRHHWGCIAFRSSPSSPIELLIDAQEVEMFLDSTFGLVPAGAESEFGLGADQLDDEDEDDDVPRFSTEDWTRIEEMLSTGS